MSGSGGKRIYEGKNFQYWNDVQKSFSNQTELKDKGIHVVSAVTKQTDILLWVLKNFNKERTSNTKIKDEIQIIQEDDFKITFEITENLQMNRYQ